MGVLALEVGLVANQYQHSLLVGVVSDLLQPLADVLEGSSRCDVVDDEQTDASAVV
jgi:hypothetical protein